MRLFAQFMASLPQILFYQTAMMNAAEIERQNRTYITAVLDGGFLS
jgi:hypothetical protein